MKACAAFLAAALACAPVLADDDDDKRGGKRWEESHKRAEKQREEAAKRAEKHWESEQKRREEEAKFHEKRREERAKFLDKRREEEAKFHEKERERHAKWAEKERERAEKYYHRRSRHFDRDDVRVGAFFNDDHRRRVRTYYVEHYGGSRGCPPGLARKNNACMPPGQAKRYYGVGEPLPRGVVVYTLPQPVLVQLPPVPPGYRYVRIGNDIVLLSPESGLVVDVIVNLLG